MRIIFDEDENCYVAETDNPDVSYRTEEDTEEEMEISKETLAAVMEIIDEAEENARKYAAQELLDTKNKSWLEKDEQPLTAGEFSERLILTDVVAMGDIVQFWFEDDDMFWGHSVRIDLNPDGSPDYAEIC